MEKRIWFFWKQGWEAAPWYVKLNYSSWVERNPGWQAVFIDDANVDELSDATRIVAANAEYITPTSFSDVLRIDLISKHGGVWADATVICMQPLDGWIDEVVAPSGFFCYWNSSPDRSIGSWFLAAKPGNPLIAKWRQATVDYWSDNVFSNQRNYHSVKRAMDSRFAVSHAATAGWFEPEITKDLQIYPYFWFHYLHNRLVATDQECADIWERTPRILGGDASTYLRRSPRDPMEDWDRQFLQRTSLRMLKLDRRFMPDAAPAGSALEQIYTTQMKITE